MSDEDIEQKDLEAEAEVLPERELMSLIAPDASDADAEEDLGADSHEAG